MKVLIVFEPSYAGSAMDAVWIIDSPSNRAWFQSHSTRIDHNSAVFNAASDALNILWTVFEHHPAWTEIVVRGEPVTVEIASDMVGVASIHGETRDGFSLKRAC